MGIYEEGSSFKSSFDWAKIKRIGKPLLIVIVVLIVIFLVYLIASSFQPPTIRAVFEKSPLSLSRDVDTALDVTITNLTEARASNVKVQVSPVDVRSLHVYPASDTIAVLGKGESRTLTFVVKPRKEDQAIFPGDYKIDIIVAMNEETFTQEIVLILEE